MFTYFIRFEDLIYHTKQSLKDLFSFILEIDKKEGEN